MKGRATGPSRGRERVGSRSEVHEVHATSPLERPFARRPRDRFGGADGRSWVHGAIVPKLRRVGQRRMTVSPTPGRLGRRLASPKAAIRSGRSIPSQSFRMQKIRSFASGSTGDYYSICKSASTGRSNVRASLRASRVDVTKITFSIVLIVLRLTPIAFASAPCVSPNRSPTHGGHYDS